MELNEEMLEILERIKGNRNPLYWDGRCRRAYEKLKLETKAVKKQKKGEYSFKYFFYLWQL